MISKNNGDAERVRYSANKIIKKCLKTFYNI